MTQFYIPPDQIPGGIPQSEPTEIAALKMQVQKMRKKLKHLEWRVVWVDDKLISLCAECRNPDYEGHKSNCELAALLETE